MIDVRKRETISGKLRKKIAIDIYIGSPKIASDEKQNGRRVSKRIANSKKEIKIK